MVIIFEIVIAIGLLQYAFKTDPPEKVLYGTAMLLISIIIIQLLITIDSHAEYKEKKKKKHYRKYRY